ncbi:hypothetical protein H8S58_19170, partial [Bacteroides sp. NSJ-2]|nr:hypothetical protein [Bacteroides hominis (ex Liu et al. 2022)]
LSQFGSNTFTNCTGVYVSQGGNASAWTIGPSTNNVSANTRNTPTFNIGNNSTATVRLVPFSGSRAITVHIGTLTLSNYFNANNRNITSSQNVQLLPGRSYAITLKFELGIQLAASDINLTQNGCTASDKNNLAKLRWATGNLKSTGSTNYVWAPSQTETGYYYTWYSTYTGNTSTNNTDPCSKLNIAYYGTGWRTPSENDYISLSRCTDRVHTNNGMWFMNKSIGVFLLAAGTIGSGGGSATNPNPNPSKTGQYWTTKKDGTNNGISFAFNPSSIFMFSDYKATGMPVRCVK